MSRCLGKLSHPSLLSRQAKTVIFISKITIIMPYFEVILGHNFGASNLGIACLPGADGKYTMVWHFFLKLVKASAARRKVRGNIIPW